MTKTVAFLFITSFILFSPCAYSAPAEIYRPGAVQGQDLPNYGEDLDKGNFFALHKMNGKFYLSKATASYSMDNISSDIENTIALISERDIKPGEVRTATTDFRVTANKAKLLLERLTYFIQETEQGLSLTGPEGESIIVPNRVSFYISWAGDLDRDGKLDLIVSSEDGDEKNSEFCLLLSSIATRNKLVRVAACQFYSG